MDLSEIGEEWKKPEMLAGDSSSIWGTSYSTQIEGTFWLSPKMWKDYYRHYMAESGDGRLSKKMGNANDDKPLKHEIAVPQ